MHIKSVVKQLSFNVIVGHLHVGFNAIGKPMIEKPEVFPIALKSPKVVYDIPYLFD